MENDHRPVRVRMMMRGHIEARGSLHARYGRVHCNIRGCKCVLDGKRARTNNPRCETGTINWALAIAYTEKAALEYGWIYEFGVWFCPEHGANVGKVVLP